MKLQKLTIPAMALMALATGAFGQTIGVVVNGQPLNFQNQQPIMQDDRVMVPLRGVFEGLGAQVNWDPATQTVTGIRGHTRVELTIGQTTASVDGHPVQLDVPAQVLQGSTMVPLRFIGEALGNNVRWDSQTNTVIISGELQVPHDWGHDHDNRRPGPPMPIPPPMYVPVPIEEFPHPVVFERNTVIPIHIGIDFNFGNVHRGQRFEAPVPREYHNLPQGSHVVGNVTNITTINNIQKVTINYTHIVTPSGARIPIKGHSESSVPHGGQPGPAVFNIHLDQRVAVKAVAVKRPNPRGH